VSEVCDVHDDRIFGEQRVEHGLSQQQTVSHELDLGLVGFRFVVKANGVTDLKTFECCGAGAGARMRAGQFHVSRLSWID
jgi:hypothetical protein